MLFAAIFTSCPLGDSKFAYIIGPIFYVLLLKLEANFSFLNLSISLNSDSLTDCVSSSLLAEVRFTCGIG